MLSVLHLSHLYTSCPLYSLRIPRHSYPIPTRTITSPGQCLQAELKSSPALHPDVCIAAIELHCFCPGNGRMKYWLGFDCVFVRGLISSSVCVPHTARAARTGPSGGRGTGDGGGRAGDGRGTGRGRGTVGNGGRAWDGGRWGQARDDEGRSGDGLRTFFRTREPWRIWKI